VQEVTNVGTHNGLYRVDVLSERVDIYAIVKETGTASSSSLSLSHFRLVPVWIFTDMSDVNPLGKLEPNNCRL